jgi:Arc/MetJ-type ribon-helix-helix transcriptional regulator
MRDRAEPARLIKLVLPAELVRGMDRAILAAAGAYQDRNEFVAEAIRDRLVEEAALRDIPSRPASDEKAPKRPTRARLHRLEPQAVIQGASLDGSVDLGSWRDGSPASLPALPTTEVNFGLHNRDFPTLWALDRLAMLSADEGAPVAWDRFLDRVRDESEFLGERLRMRDLAKPTALRVGIGFPKPGPKIAASIDRFVASNVGSGRRADGPFFVLALAAFADREHERLAPTDAGLRVLSDMIERGLGPDLPQPPDAFECWWGYTSELAPAEHAAWLKVLQVIEGEPTREALTHQFPEWRGHTATTNTVGFVSRSREWGLTEPEMIEGRYRLTNLGRTVLRRA